MSPKSRGGDDPPPDPPGDPYEVGYRRPPLHSRFKPGQSGNPRGRPKGPKSIDQALQQALKRRVSDPRGGRRKISMLQLIVESLVVGAAKRDPRMLRLLIGLLDRHGENNTEGPSNQELATTDREILETFAASLTASKDGGDEQ